MMFIKRITLIVVMMTQVGCATIFQGSPDDVPISSNPPGADVYLNNRHVGVTPTQLRIRHSDDADISVRKAGYHDVNLTLHKVLAGWTLANIVLGHAIVVGFAVDLITHNQGKYPTDRVDLDLQSTAQASR